MTKLSKNTCFRDQILRDDIMIFRVSTIRTHFFYSPLFVGFLIQRQIDGTHTAVSDFCQYSVFTADYGSNFKHNLPPLSK